MLYAPRRPGPARPLVYNIGEAADNARGIHLYEKMGFQHEGRISRGIRVNGQFYDHNAMGLTID